MSKVLGYSNKGGKDWFTSDAYHDKEIQSIKDPEGGSGVISPTAIPSPFARIDLVKTAFRNISKTDNLKSSSKDNTIIASRNDEKLVSDCLDLAEILFNYDSLQDRINIIAWDRENDLNKLKSGSVAHKRLAETLELYLEQDKQTYNFDKVRRLYLFEYKYKIIGCTSPVTLFFTTGNDLSDVQIKLTKNDITFDSNYATLYDRDPDFQKYIYAMFKAYPEMSKLLPDFWNYLNQNLKILDKKNHELYIQINELKLEDFKNNYNELNTGNLGNDVEVLGYTLRKRKRDEIQGQVIKSDFVIKSTKYTGKHKPLVLQNDLNKPNFIYVKDQWNINYKVPFYDKESDVQKRWLPEVKIQYPYLTVNDFLEPNLIRLVYPLNDEKFYNGNLTNSKPNDKAYLLPLKRQFFDYFSTEDLLNNAPDSPKIEIYKLSAGNGETVIVTLQIPIAKKGEYITFTKKYNYESKKNIFADDTMEKGSIIEHQVGLTIFPFLRVNNSNVVPFYRLQLVDRGLSDFTIETDFDLRFYNNNDLVSITSKKIRSKKTDLTEATSQYFVLSDNFDFIQVTNKGLSGVSGIIIPKWKLIQGGNQEFSFAVDFGTTNTHVEYNIDNSRSKSFDITSNDIQTATLYHPKNTTQDFAATGAIAIRELVVDEFVPELIGDVSGKIGQNGSMNNLNFRFPHRTVIGESNLLNLDTDTYTLADFNIPFSYEKKHGTYKVQTNLKWAKRALGNERRIKSYVEKLIMLMRNKVLLNGGNLAKTKLVWFFPSSMKPSRKAALEKIWNDLFKIYFNSEIKPTGISESMAPFYFYKGSNRVVGGASTPVVSIDIGGGTTDVVVFKSNKPLLMTSFRFAANTLFGDGYSESGAAETNGLLKKYTPIFEKLFTGNEGNKHNDLKKVLSEISKANKSEDINTFLFSLESYFEKLEQKELFSYNKLLSKDQNIKIIFLYFYTAIVYHVAYLMKNNDIALPKHIIFSGTGSKILNIITNSVVGDKSILSKFTKLVFEKVYGPPGFDSEGLTIEMEMQMPKEVTSKGGLLLKPEDLNFEIREIKKVLTFLKDSEEQSLHYGDLDNDSKLKSKLIEQVKIFNKEFLEFNKEYNFGDFFDVSKSAITLFTEEIDKHISDYLHDGIDFSIKLDDNLNSDSEVEESLFFYPLTGSINSILSKLANLTDEKV